MTQCLWFTSRGQACIRKTPLATPGPGEVLVSALYSAISRGTELLVYRGQVPESEYARMRAPFQHGELPFPVAYGYSSVGQVVGGAPELAGKRVFCLYPHQTRYVVPASAVVVIPEAVPSARAVLAANMETALNALWDARPLPGDRVTVIGAGAVGCLTSSLLTRIPGVDVEVVDIDANRQALVELLGGRFVTPQSPTPERDLVFHTSASPDGLQLALSLLRQEGTLIELSWYGSHPIHLQLGGAFHAKRLKLISSQVGTVSPNKPTWTHRQRLQLALQLLTPPELDHLLTPPHPFNSLPQIFKAISAGTLTPTAPTTLIQYPQPDHPQT